MSRAVTSSPTRRGLLTGWGVTAAGTGFFALLGGHAADAQASAPAEADLIAALLQVEQVLVIAYRQAFRSQQLGKRAAARLRPLDAHARAHVSMLRQQLDLLGSASPPPHTPDLADAQKLLSAHQVSQSLIGLRSEGDCLRLLLAAENVVIGAFFKVMSQLASPARLRLAAGIMAGEAQHALVLGELLHPRDITQAAPNPFVQGTA